MLNNNIKIFNTGSNGNRKSLSKYAQQNKQIKFGLSLKSGLAKKSADFLVNEVDSLLKKPEGLGQFSSNVINYGGKALIAPLMILAGSKYTDENKNSIKTSMLLEPVSAGITFMMATSFGFVANKVIGKMAELGKFGEFYTKKAHIKELKNISTIAMTALSIPVAAKLISWALPNVKSKIAGKEMSQNLNADMYSAKLDRYSVFAETLRPKFGNLTRRQEKA